MHRVELKAERPNGLGGRGLRFLMHRVELKVLSLLGFAPQLGCS